MKHLPRIIIYLLLTVLTLYVVSNFLMEQTVLKIPFTKAILIKEMDKEVVAHRVDSIKKIMRVEFWEEFDKELAMMKPEVKEIFVETIETDTTQDSLVILYSESILFDTLYIDDYPVFNKYLVSARTINFPVIDFGLKRFENNFTYKEIIYVEQDQSRLKKIETWAVRILAAIGAFKVVESVR